MYSLLLILIISRSKFKAGAENVKSSLQSITPQELLALLDSKDYVGSVVAKEKYNGKVKKSRDVVSRAETHYPRQTSRKPTMSNHFFLGIH